MNMTMIGDRAILQDMLYLWRIVMETQVRKGPGESRTWDKVAMAGVRLPEQVPNDAPEIVGIG